MNKLNVCLLNDSFPPEIDGVANAVVNYAQIINGKLGSASVVTPSHPEANDGDFDFPVIRYPSIDMTKMVGYRAGIPFNAKTMSELQKSGFDIIHSHCPITSTMLSRMLRDRIDKPVGMTYHTKFDIDIANAIHGKLFQEEAAKLLVKNISACDEVWTVSRGAGENLEKLGYRGDWRVMPNGVDIPVGRADENEIAQAVGDYDLPGGVPVFLFVGRMMWYKGVKISLDALKILLDGDIDFRMVFIGAGLEKNEIMAYASSLGLDGKVFFSPAIRDRAVIKAWYTRADMFLFPSTFDTNGLVVREAAACALGSVLVRGSCAAEDVTEGRNGVLIDENAQSMAEALEKLCREPSEMGRIGENAQRELYISWEETVKNAYERYGVITERYKSGLCGAHEMPSDELFHTAAELMDRYSLIREYEKLKREETVLRYAELKSNVIDDISYLEEQQLVRRNISIMKREELRREIEESREKIVSCRKHITADAQHFNEELKAGLRRRIEEIGQSLDRFM